MKRIAVIVGTRPEAIKLAPVVKALRQMCDAHTVLVSSGQHREMLQEALSVFGLVPDLDLDVMRPAQTLASLTAALSTGLERAMRELRPDFAIVQGDTTTCLMGTLVSFYHGVPVGHVEAGLRSGDLRAPFPEEGNRALVSRLASIHFAPTAGARDNLLREGISERSVLVTGNTVIDALLSEIQRQTLSGDVNTIRERLAADLGRAWWTHRYVLITGHRRENFGQGFEEICAAIAELATMFPDHEFIYPVHLNPEVQRPVRQSLQGSPNIKLIPPQSYPEFVRLLADCRLVLTDSGGVQEEAPSLGKPVLVMRDVTERPEAVLAGTSRLVGSRRTSIIEGVRELLTDEPAYHRMARAANPFGDGQASARIATFISERLSNRHPATA